jgi:phage protein U
MFALLGEIPFAVIGSPEAFETSRRFEYAEQRVVEDRPRLQWLGDGLETITLAMLFHASFTDPAAQYDALLAAAEDHQARALVLGNGAFRGFFVVEALAASNLQLAADATPLAIRVRVRLREWAPGAELDPTMPPRPAGVPLGLAPAPISFILPAPASGAAAPATSYVAPIFALPGVSALIDNPAPTGPAGPEVSYADVPPSMIVRSAR